MYKFRIVHVERVNGRFNVHFREMGPTDELLEEYVVGCQNDEIGHITAQVRKFFMERDEPHETPPAHPLVDEEFEV